jgi:uncharacterized protein YaaW (UPF0174 family)
MKTKKETMAEEFDEKWWSLSAVLQVAENKDLHVLVDHLTDDGKGRSTLSTVHLELLTACRNAGVYGHADRNVIAEEIRLFGGNSIANKLRGGEGAPYQEIVLDAAKQLKLEVDSWESAISVEVQILRRLFLDALDAMQAEERRETLMDVGLKDLPAANRADVATALRNAPAHGDIRTNVARFVASRFAGSASGVGLATAKSAGVGAVVGAGLTVGALPVAVAWGLVALAGAAYRVTVPCVIQVAYIRQKAYHKRETGDVLDVVGPAALSEKKPWMPSPPKLKFVM